MQKIIEKFVQNHKRPRFAKIIKGNKILVLAPHPDDEIIGAGGTLIKHVAVENPIHIVFVTDGGKGRSRDKSIEETITTRLREAQNVCNRLGVSHTFLDCEDGDYIPEKNKIELLRELIKNFEPTDIFIPHINDSHRDHFMTNLLFFESIRDRDNKESRIWEYEVWSPLNPNTVVNISHEFKRKKELMSLYQSQLKLIPYQEIMEGLNKYRVSTLPMPGITYMESFYCSEESNYKEKIKKTYLKGE